MNIKLLAPVGYPGSTVNGVTSATYTIGTDRTVTVDTRDCSALLAQGFTPYAVSTAKVSFSSPLPADLVSVKAAATPANGAITIAAQPVHSRKLQVRVVLGTPGTTDITAGTLTLVGTDQDGNAITEVISLVTGASVTRTTANAFATLTSGTVAGYAANGSGTGNTLGIGVSNDFGIPTMQGGTTVNFSIIKVTKITKVLGTSNVAADDAAGSAVVDTVARTVAPTTAPAANGLVDYEIKYAYGTGI